MTEAEDHRVLKFTKEREMIAEAVNLSRYYNHIIGIVEMDVTKAMAIMKRHEEKIGEKLSITSWIMKCVAQAVEENPIVQTFRKGRRKMIQFKDVDIKCLVEKEIRGRKVPIAYIIRQANKKSFQEIQNEIRTAQKYSKDQREKEAKQKKRQKLLMKLPKMIRALLWRSIIKDPFKIRKNLGTVGVTAMGMFGKGIVGYAIPKTFHATTCALGAIVKKPVYINDELVPRDILHVVVEFDHDIVDGAPAVRFVSRLHQLLSEAFGLEAYAND
ncbi:MAG: 2-oxo acid dehydrogenase subunit E2 [Candidatus Heimdallarchaeota archaeon]